MCRDRSKIAIWGLIFRWKPILLDETDFYNKYVVLKNLLKKDITYYHCFV